MAIRLIELSLLSAEEAQDVRVLLTESGISVYETPESNWGGSMAAIWLSDENQLESAQLLLVQYRQNQSRKKRKTKPRSVRTIETGLPARGILLALSVAGGVVFLGVVAMFFGEIIPLGRSLDARGGMIELYLLWAVLFFFGVVWAVRYFVVRRRKNNAVSSQKTDREVR